MQNKIPLQVCRSKQFYFRYCIFKYNSYGYFFVRCIKIENILSCFELSNYNCFVRRALKGSIGRPKPRKLISINSVCRTGLATLGLLNSIQSRLIHNTKYFPPLCAKIITPPTPYPHPNLLSLPIFKGQFFSFQSKSECQGSCC